MATKYEYNNPPPDGYRSINAVSLNGQVFTPESSHLLTKIVFKGRRRPLVSTINGCICNVKDNGEPDVGVAYPPPPTGGLRYFGPIDLEGISPTYPEEGSVDIIPPLNVEAGTKYCILWWHEEFGHVYSRFQLCDGGTYPRGYLVYHWLAPPQRWYLYDGIHEPESRDMWFEEWGEPAIVAPTVTTDPASGIMPNSATQKGTLDDDGGEACDCGFQYGIFPNFTDITPTQSKTTGQTFSQSLSGLLPNTTYQFRAIATNSVGSSYGATRTFTTTVGAPAVTTDPSTGISTLNGTLDDDGGVACACGFEWGLTGAYGNTTPTQSRVTEQSFSQTIGGLAPGTTYHFRAFATNLGGTNHGADRTFTTSGSLPVVITDPETGLGMTRAVPNGTLYYDGGEVCACGFEWGFDTNYGITTPPESKVTGETFDEIISGLFPDTTYHFRAWATNSYGTGYGADRAFTTKPAFSKAYALAREEL